MSRRLVGARSVASLQRWLAAMIVLFTVSAAGLLIIIADRHAALSEDAQHQLLWAATRMGKEFRDFRHSLDLFAVGEPETDAHDVRLMHDLLYSRMNTFRHGQFARALEQDPAVLGQVRRIAAEVFAMEPVVAALGKGDLTLLEALRAQHAALELVVRDNGIGMTPDDIAVALAPFGQVEHHLARRYGGAGLGLSITKLLVELHRGDLVIESVKGAGTAVRLRFPATRVLAGAAANGGLSPV